MFGLAGAMVTIDMDVLISDCESFCIQDCLYALMPLLVGGDHGWISIDSHDDLMIKWNDH